MNVFFDDKSCFFCECTGSTFVDKDHNYILTATLIIINYNKLRELFSKCPNHCENRTAGYQKAKESVITEIKSCVQSWRNKQGVIKSPFSKWKESVILAITEYISHLSTKRLTENSQSTLKLKEKIIIEELQFKFVFLPIDMTSSNFAFVYQSFDPSGWS